MTHQDTADQLMQIARDGLCTGCGLCESIAGSDRVRMRVSPLNYLRPEVIGPLDQATVDIIHDSCPGLRQDSLPPELLAQDTRTDPIWGPYRQMYSAHATDEPTRIRAASGGVLTALCKFLIDSGRVAHVAHARPSSGDPTHGDAHISRTSAEVDAGTGSIYGPTAPLADILALLDLGQPFAFVGKPCDISALRNYADHEPRINTLIRYWLTPICGGIVPPPQMDGFLASRGVTREDLKSFAYRGDGCPGDTQFTTKDGQSFSAVMYEPYGGIAESDWQLPFRCKICPDGPGEAADIAAGDQWVDDVPDWEFAKVDKGTNAVILRTLAGEELWNAAVKAGYITVEQTITPRFYDTCQHHHVVKKMHTRARWDGVGKAGSLVPRSTGLRLDEFHARNPDRENAAQSAGAARRAADAREDL